ncbi:GFA family protein [Photobacterium sp. CCB-ST2H9]|uniref:GFA family protein n=1 Tax=Photobacterium sp. CCB-ST2H9 TaxID=2912855 RepID=UPI002002A3E0|nr:GFA family protein [Photobacterium sp. CCB-ST2H9]UTM58591.1 GFA family protein [Photobacterium sp. CCB-ST2H9]
MYTGECHCGNVQLKISHLTKTATRCNCSVCRRYAALWGYFTESEVEITVGKSGLESYEHGDRYISFHRCQNCGCMTHYTSTPKAQSDRVAVNYHMFPMAVISSVHVRHFDGADSWKFLDE